MWDKEYATSYVKGRDYLTNKGIRWTFAKTRDSISEYKYDKNEELFLALAEFYKYKKENGIK